MGKEPFKPIPVQSKNLFLLNLRCLIDFQLKTIFNFLQSEFINLEGNIIDVGAGESPWKRFLSNKSTYTGLDIEGVNNFGMKQVDSDLILYDGKIIPFESNLFDGALCIEVLEHSKNPNLLLSEISRILKPKSTLLLTIPWSARRHHIPNDYHRFSKEQLFILLENNGFTKISIQERGNDYCVVTNKLIILIIRNTQLMNITNFFYKIPFVIFILIFTTLMLVISHITLIFDDENNEDPLGYACKAEKK